MGLTQKQSTSGIYRERIFQQKIKGVGLTLDDHDIPLQTQGRAGGFS
jgi:hypothetical protein